MNLVASVGGGAGRAGGSTAQAWQCHGVAGMVAGARDGAAMVGRRAARVQLAHLLYERALVVAQAGAGGADLCATWGGTDTGPATQE